MRVEPECSMANAKKTQPTSGDAPSPCPPEDWKKLIAENLELERKIEQLEAIVYAKGFDTAHIKAMVEPFSGDDLMRVRTWIDKLEEAFGVLKLNKTQQLIAACDLLTGTAETFRGTVRFKDYDDFKAQLLQEFQGHECSDDGVVKELRKKKLQDSNVLRFVLEMIKAADGYDVAEADLVDIIIDGLADNTMLVVMLYGAKTIAELKSLLPRYIKRRFPAGLANSSTAVARTNW